MRDRTHSVGRRRATAQSEADRYVEAALPRLMGLALAMTRQPADAEDLVQETLATVMARWSRVSAAQDVDAYVRRVMVNTLLSRVRRRSHSEVVTDAVSERVDTRDAPREVDDRDEVLALLRDLTVRQRTVLALRYYEDLPDAAIAEAMGCSVQAVRNAAHAGLRALRATTEASEPTTAERTGSRR